MLLHVEINRDGSLNVYMTPEDLKTFELTLLRTVVDNINRKILERLGSDDDCLMEQIEQSYLTLSKLAIDSIDSK